MSWMDDLAARFVGDADDAARALQLSATIEGGGDEAAAAFLELARLLGESTADPAGLIAALDDLGLTAVIDQLGGLVLACFAAVRVDYPSRQDAQAARAALSECADAVIDDAGAAYGADLHAFLMRLAGETVVQISALAATAAPLVRVETGLSLPSSLIAYDLYGDPARGAELVARNRTGTPLVMPVSLEALAS